jgi:hypothetical protein
MLASNPSADPGAKTEAGYRKMPRFAFVIDEVLPILRTEKLTC